MEKRFIVNLHASLDSACKSRISKLSHVSGGGVHSTPFDPKLRNERFTLISKLRNERFTLISFMAFPAMLKALWPFQFCIFNRKDSK